jgi:hypothetical protein
MIGLAERLDLHAAGFGREELEMDLLKEALDLSFITVQVTARTSVRALSLEDTVGLKARAWHDRFVIRDIIDLPQPPAPSPTSTSSVLPAVMTRPRPMTRLSAQ